MIMNINGDIIPVEIKSGRHKRSQSLKNYVNENEPAYSVRISENNFGEAGGILAVPLYAVFCLGS